MAFTERPESASCRNLCRTWTLVSAGPRSNSVRKCFRSVLGSMPFSPTRRAISSSGEPMPAMAWTVLLCSSVGLNRGRAIVVILLGSSGLATSSIFPIARHRNRCRAGRERAGCPRLFELDVRVACCHPSNRHRDKRGSDAVGRDGTQRGGSRRHCDWLMFRIAVQAGGLPLAVGDRGLDVRVACRHPSNRHRDKRGSDAVGRGDGTQPREAVGTTIGPTCGGRQTAHSVFAGPDGFWAAYHSTFVRRPSSPQGRGFFPPNPLYVPPALSPVS